MPLHIDYQGMSAAIGGNTPGGLQRSGHGFHPFRCGVRFSIGKDKQNRSGIGIFTKLVPDDAMAFLKSRRKESSPVGNSSSLR